MRRRRIEVEKMMIKTRQNIFIQEISTDFFSFFETDKYVKKIPKVFCERKFPVERK